MKAVRHRGPWREAGSSRRRQVASRLGDLGLAGVGRRKARGPLLDGELGERIRSACLELGPAFAAFGRYLSSRADLLMPLDCLALTRIPDEGEPVPPDRIRWFVEEELGPLETLFAAFDDAPLSSGLRFQWHRAVTVAGEPLVVKVVRPDLDQRFGEDLALLDLLQPPGSPLDGTAAEFRAALAASLDLRAEARGLLDLAREEWATTRLALPRVVPDACSGRVLSSRWPDGNRLDGLDAGPAAAAVARRLGFAWLRQVLLGRAVPEEPDADSLVVPAGAAIAFLGGPVASVPVAAQESFSALLAAVAQEDPDAACAVLRRQMTAAPEAVGEEDLLLRLRQVVPFRDGAWSPGGQSLPELVFAYWRVAREGGYRAPRPLLPLVRGLTTLAATVRSLDPEGDPFRDALREVRLERSFGRAGTVPRMDEVAERLAPYAGLLSELPRKLDELLTLAVEGEMRLKLHAAETETRRRRSDPWIRVMALSASLVALGLVVPRLLGGDGLAGWGERLVAVAVALLGGALLWTAGGGD